jgi:SAM-dependent methyltransferase
MDDNTIEIRDDKIDGEEIMIKIRKNIRRRQAAGELPPDPDSVIGYPSNDCAVGRSDDAIEGDLSYCKSNWDIHNKNYIIRSHRPYIGKFLIKGRQLIHEEVRRYVDPIISRQTEFNASTVRSSIQTSQGLFELNQRQQELERTWSSLNNKMEKDIQAKAWLAQVLENRVQKGLAQKCVPPLIASKENLNYFLFEERFRGSRENITKRQLEFLPFFEKCSHVLDIGCGRGEFLEILKNHDIGGIGVDIDPDMVAYCRSLRLNVEHSDAIAYLERLEDKTLDGIFIDQVVEHMEPDYLIRLLALCHQKMKFGYYVVVETVNPLSFVSFVNFYIDMTHKRPVHPETLLYLFNASGFRECEEKFFSPVSDELILKKIEVTADMNATERKNIEIYDNNIEMLNSVLFGNQDYAVVGKK